MADPSVEEKHRQAFELRLSGASFQKIADELGYADPSSAFHAVQRGLEQARKSDPATVSDRLALELERLDALQVAVWRKAAGGNLSAIDRALKIMDARVKLSHLDKVVGENAADDGVDEVARARAARRQKFGG